jgi:hypothetical protein
VPVVPVISIKWGSFEPSGDFANRQQLNLPGKIGSLELVSTHPGDDQITRSHFQDQTRFSGADKMMKRCVAMIAVAALVLLSSTAAVEAGHRPRARMLRPIHSVTRQASPHTTAATYPRVRQIDGRSLWDLGKQNGQWPPIRF